MAINAWGDSKSQAQIYQNHQLVLGEQPLKESLMHWNRKRAILTRDWRAALQSLTNLRWEMFMDANRAVVTASHPAYTGKRVLICEDEALTVLQLQKALTRVGMVVIECTNDSEHAIAIAVQEKPDIVLMDLGIGGRNGVHAAREILSHTQTCLIFVTGHSDPEIISEALATGAAGYIVKPVASAELFAAIDRYCGMPEHDTSPVCLTESSPT